MISICLKHQCNENLEKYLVCMVMIKHKFAMHSLNVSFNIPRLVFDPYCVRVWPQLWSCSLANYKGKNILTNKKTESSNQCHWLLPFIQNLGLVNYNYKTYHKAIPPVITRINLSDIPIIFSTSLYKFFHSFCDYIIKHLFSFLYCFKIPVSSN